jgi:ferredoxin-NADP reductase
VVANPSSVRMTKYITKLNERRDLAEGTMAFHLEKPSGFQFKPGQYMNVTLIDPPETDAEGNTRSFSIASAPFEADLVVATRLRDTAFKRVFRTLTLKSEVRLSGPFGSFTLHTDASRPAVFLVGGIGITPFRSMILQAAKDKLAHKLYLFYSNRRPEDAAFLDELQKTEKENSNYKFIGTMTDTRKSKRPWQGETGHISHEMLTKWIRDLNGPIYYSAGPPGMVAAMRQVLTTSGIGDDNIRTEEFTGY